MKGSCPINTANGKGTIIVCSFVSLTVKFLTPDIILLKFWKSCGANNKQPVDTVPPAYPEELVE